MRTPLAPYLDKYVLCKGWIADWEDMPECSTRRVFVSQPTIKKANKNLLFKEQEVISTEHHLNLFIRYEDLTDYDAVFELNSPISFTGVIERYTRSDGSIDYGVYANKQSTIAFKLERLIKSLQETMNTERLEDINLEYLSTAALRQLRSLKDELEECGDMLPTFNKTYEQYLFELDALTYGVAHIIKRARDYLGSREYRRSKKRKGSPLSHISSIPDSKKKKRHKPLKSIHKLQKGFNQEVIPM